MPLPGPWRATANHNIHPGMSVRLAQWDVLHPHSPAELGRVRGETWNRRPLEGTLECAGATLESPPALLGHYCMFRNSMESHRGNRAPGLEGRRHQLLSNSRHLYHGQ
ncbi:hypothetical protein V2G26_003486 [Clonostachys chloroleuca]